MEVNRSVNQCKNSALIYSFCIYKTMLLAQATLTQPLLMPLPTYTRCLALCIFRGWGEIAPHQICILTLIKIIVPARSSVSTPTGTKVIRRRQLQSPGREKSIIAFWEQKHYIRSFMVSIPWVNSKYRTISSLSDSFPG